MADEQQVFAVVATAIREALTGFADGGETGGIQ